MTRFVGLMVLAMVGAACSNSTEPQHLRFEARSSVSQSTTITVQTEVTVTNDGPTTTQIEVSTCPRAIEGFTTPERTGAPLWRIYGGEACDAAARIRMLGPGDYYVYNFGPRQMPANLPPANYYLAVDMGYQLVPAGQFSTF
jgi:hypothetical protein